jgi:hypothetical protein
MKGIHPNLGLIALAVVACALVGAGGCSHKTGMSNPFLAPDRVSPPSTRVIAPGTALPYYQGDPLPVMQSAAPVSTPAVAPAPPAEPKQIAFSNEPSVSVPSDDSSLRFELPKPPEPEPTPVTPLADARVSPAAAPSEPTAWGVVPAVFNSAAPVTGQQFDRIVAPSVAVAEPAASGQWRSPQIAAPTPPAAFAPAPPMYGVPPGYVVVPPTATPQSAGVTLRAVASPPPEPVESSTPRIRIPGYPAPPVSMNPVTISPVMPASSGVSSDGFRPRSSMR